MAEPAEFMIGARASCSDGSCGEVRRVIIKPETLAVTHLVVDPGHDPARLVPFHLVDTVAGEIRLRCSLAEFGRLDRAEETDVYEDIGDPGGPLSGMGVGVTSRRQANGIAASSSGASRACKRIARVKTCPLARTASTSSG